jgi:hypothetical protein
MLSKNVLVGALVLGLACVVMADEIKTVQKLSIAQSIKKQDKNTVGNVTQMMAHLSFAAQAIDLKMKNSALSNLKKAKKLCSKIERSRPETITSYKYKFGKTTYFVEGEHRDYYIPVYNDVSSEGQFDERSIWGKNPKVDEQGLAIVQSKLQLNLKNVASSIIAAEKLTKEDKFVDAGNALGGIFKDAMSSLEVVTDPVWAVWSNIRLAQQFLKGGKYKSAQFALDSAKSDLVKIEKDGIVPENREDAKKLKLALENIQNTLDKAAIKKLQKNLKVWSTKINDWIIMEAEIQTAG